LEADSSLALISEWTKPPQSPADETEAGLTMASCPFLTAHHNGIQPSLSFDSFPEQLPCFDAFECSLFSQELPDPDFQSFSGSSTHGTWNSDVAVDRQHDSIPSTHGTWTPWTPYDGTWNSDVAVDRSHDSILLPPIGSFDQSIPSPTLQPLPLVLRRPEQPPSETASSKSDTSAKWKRHKKVEGGYRCEDCSRTFDIHRDLK